MIPGWFLVNISYVMFAIMQNQRCSRSHFRLFFSWDFFCALLVETKALKASADHKEDAAMSRASQFEPEAAVSGRQNRGGMKESERI